jgi:hypothetical protein
MTVFDFIIELLLSLASSAWYESAASTEIIYHFIELDLLYKPTFSLTSCHLKKIFEKFLFLLLKYIYCNKSGDHKLQRESYSGQKSRHLVKCMSMVFPDGYIRRMKRTGQCSAEKGVTGDANHFSTRLPTCYTFGKRISIQHNQQYQYDRSHISSIKSTKCGCLSGINQC